MLSAQNFRFWLGLALAMCVPLRVQAQVGQGQIPNATYWTALALYQNGDFASARKGFQEAAHGGIKSQGVRWVDSICFHTMLGECDYQLGDLNSALDQYTSALKLYLANPNWMLSIEFPANINVGKGTAITWGNSSRNSPPGSFPDRYMLIQNTLNAVGGEGGNLNLITGKQAIPVHAAEISRCTGIALRRRRELMAMVSARDPFSETLVAAFARKPAPPNSWASCWTNIHSGLAYAAAGKTNLAASELASGLQAGGLYDHPLTSMALLELGQMAFHEGKFENAATYFMEATYSAAHFNNLDDLEEGFRGALLCWHMLNKNGPFTVLNGALTWSSATKNRKLDVALRLLAADNLILLGDSAGAAAALSVANKSMFRSEMLNSRYGVRWQFESARVNFAMGELAAGAANLATAMKFQQASSKWLYQIALADTFITNGTITDREADVLYSEVLRDPTAYDWSVDPLEALSVASSTYPLAFEHWFTLALARKDTDKAMEIADRLRRHRFYASLPLGGRLLALRWLLEAPPEMLDPKTQLARQDLLVKYPPYAQASLQAAAIQKELATLPLVVEDEEQLKKQAELYAKLTAVSTTQEIMLRNIALRRDASDYVFPPTLVMKDMQQNIPPRTLVFAFIQINGKLHGFAIGREKSMAFSPDALSKMKTDLSQMLRTWGLVDKNQLLDAKDLLNENWRPTARKLLKTLTNNMKDENWELFDELVIVPDSLVWYVPWEAFPLSDAPDAPLLTTKLKVRTVPTLALALPDKLPKKPFDRTAIVAGKMFPKDDIAIAAGAYEQLKRNFPNAGKVKSAIPAASPTFLSQADQLVVFHDLDEPAKGIYDWAPCPVDKGKPTSAMSEWFALPWFGPRQVLLPGFHTAAENSLKKGGTGDELFLTSCAFLASGSRTVLLNRWKSGGQANYDLIREYAIESPFSSASAAWQRSVQLLMQSPLDLDREPRIQPSNKLEGLKGDHPVFWAGYTLIDTGALPLGTPAPPVVKPDAKPAAKVEAKEEPKPAEKMVEKMDAEKKPAGKAPLPAEVEALNPERAK
jgi:tetratricopeptide (TPR) repeat protein